MFRPSQKVICVDDTNQNPLCEFPCGYVVRGRIYYVAGVTPAGGIQIEGLPVIGYLPANRKYDDDVGWKRHRFRKYDERSSDVEIGDSSELELVGAGSGR